MRFPSYSRTSSTGKADDPMPLTSLVMKVRVFSVTLCPYRRLRLCLELILKLPSFLLRRILWVCSGVLITSIHVPVGVPILIPRGGACCESLFRRNRSVFIYRKSEGLDEDEATFRERALCPQRNAEHPLTDLRACRRTSIRGRSSSPVWSRVHLPVGYLGFGGEFVRTASLRHACHIFQHSERCYGPRFQSGTRKQPTQTLRGPPNEKYQMNICDL